jgi:transcriptional regulator with XRE-family HTH domain
MDTTCPVAKFVRQQIQILGKSQREIAQEVGFEKPNVITMIKQGKTKLPMAKVGRMAKALETDPVHLMKLCMNTYHPDTWQYIEPFLESALTKDEVLMLRTWRSFVGAPYVAALTDESKALLKNFLLSLRTSPICH